MKKILFVTNATGIGGSEKVLNTILRKIEKGRYELSVFSITDNYEDSFHISGLNLVNKASQYEASVSGLKAGIMFGIRSRKAGFLYAVIKYWLSHQCHRNNQYLFDWWKAYGRVLPTLELRYDIAIAFGAGMAVPITLEKVKAKKKIAWVNFDLQKLFEESTSRTVKFYSDCYASFDEIVTITAGNYDAFIKAHNGVFNQNRVRIIHDLIDISQIIKLSDVEDPFEHNDCCNILTVGRLSPEKGYDLLISAATILSQRKRKFRWFVVGNGKQETYHKLIQESELEGKVILLGGKSNPYPYFKNCDIYVQTSLHEGNCLTLAEAMILGRPCVTTNFPTGIEKVENGINGLVVEMNPLSIADGVDTLIINQGNVRQKYGEAAMCKMIQTEDEINKIYELFDSLE